jgi:hypothetical protein
MTQPSISSIHPAAAFFAAVTPKTEPYDLPGVGTVDLVELRERDVAEIRKAAEAEKDATRRTRAFGYGLVVRSVRKGGQAVFTDADIERFAEAGNAAVEKLAAAVLRINGYGADPGN